MDFVYYNYCVNINNEGFKKKCRSKEKKERKEKKIQYEQSDIFVADSELYTIESLLVI